MKIGHKLILGFVGIALLVVLMGYISVKASQKALQESIGRSSVALADKMMEHIDRGIFHRIEIVQEYAKNSITRRYVGESNQEFARLSNIQAYIAQQDREWTSAPPEEKTPFMQELIDKELSRILRENMRFYEEKYGYQVTSEIFVTNQYGANMAQTGKTSDYYQADEEWWQMTRENGLYVSDVELDESSRIYSTNICIRIDDSAGNFAGVIKAIINVDDTIEDIRENEEKKYTDLKLLTRSGKVIYASDGSEFFESLPINLLSRLQTSEIARDTRYFIAAGDKTGEGKELFAYAHSQGYKDYKGLGWIFLIEQETRKIFAPVVKLRNRILFFSLAITVVTVGIGWVIFRSIFIPVNKLTKAAAEIGQGNLAVQVAVKSNDEIGYLARTFNTMVSNIKNVTASRDVLNNEIAMRRQTEEELKVAKTTLEQQFEEMALAQDAALNMIEDIENENAERKKTEKKLLESEERIKIILDTLHAGMLLVDARTHIIADINSAAAEMFGAPKEEIIGRKCHQYICPAEEGKCPISDLGLKIDNSERILLNRQKKQIPVLKNVTTLTLNGHPYLLESFVDITERKKVEQKLETLNSELEFTVQKLSQSNQQLQEFVYIASHDLREPVRKIAAFGQLLTEALAGKLDADDKENFDFMIDGANRMQQMIESLLVYSRVTTRAAEAEPVDLNQAIEQLKKLELSNNLEETGGTIVIPESLPLIKGDSAQMRQLFQNLIGNALKYHKKDVPPEVIISARRKDDNMVRIEIQDNGIGIKAEHYAGIFAMFRRLHSRQEYEGTGIGLAVCKRIVEKHHGEIGVDSTFGQGSTFWFTLPAEIALAQEPVELNCHCNT